MGLFETRLHDVADGDEAQQFAVANDRQVTEATARHQLHDMVDRIVGVAGHDIAGHDAVRLEFQGGGAVLGEGVHEVALDGAFLLGKAIVPQMVARGGGAFVALSGISTHVGTPNRCHVSASKSGLEGLMRALAVELAPHRITCNALAPGAIDTTRGAAAGARPAVNRPIPLKRFGTVEEIAAMVRLLVGPEGTFITGQTIHVNGGEFLT